MLAGIRRGDEKVYRELFRTYYRPLVVFATNYVHDLDTARDIVQALFVHLYDSRTTLKIRSSIPSYLYQAVRNRCLNHLGSSRSRQTELDESLADTSGENPVEEEIQRNETEHRIFLVVESLPAKCREIFLLSRVKGLSNSEIADRLYISKRTVETQISKALKAIREKIS